MGSSEERKGWILENKIGEKNVQHYTCFNCGGSIVTPLTPCPYCGYKVDGDNLRCPNLMGTICSLTDNICSIRGDYGRCPVKNKFDHDDDI